MGNELQKKWWVPVLIISLFCLMQVLVATALTLGNPVNDFREAQVASTTRMFAEDGVNLLYPKLNLMGNPGYFVLEFPIYQGLTACLWDIFGLQEIWGRVLSHLFWVLAAFYLYYLCLLYGTEIRLAILTCFLFLFAPISIFYAHSIGIEAMSVCLTIIFLYYGSRWIINGSFSSFVIALLICTLSFVQKLPNIAPMFLPLLAVKYVYGGKKIRSVFNPLFILLGLIPLVAAVIWQKHAQHVNLSYPGSAWHNAAETFHWYFGTLSQRVNPARYLIVIFKSLENAFGSIYFGVIVIIGLFFAKRFYFFAFYLLAYLLSYLIFPNLHISHSHYMIPFLAPTVFFASVGILALWDKLKLPEFNLGKLRINERLVKSFIIVCAVGLLFINQARYLDFRDFIYKDQDVICMADIIKEHTPEDGRVMIYWSSGVTTGTWDPQLMYLAHRRGSVVYRNELEDGDIVQMMNEKKCDYLVLAGDSLKFLFVQGRKLHSYCYWQRADFSVLDNFTLRFEPELEEKLGTLESLYKGSRIRIYKKPR